MPNIDWNKFTQLGYWFEGVAGQVSKTSVIDKGSFFFWFFLWLFTMVFAIGVSLRWAKVLLHPENPLVAKFNFWGSNIIGMGVAGTTWFLMRQLEVGFLGARFWLLVILIWFLVLLGFAIRYFSFYFKIEMLFFKQKLNLGSKK